HGRKNDRRDSMRRRDTRQSWRMLRSAVLASLALGLALGASRPTVSATTLASGFSYTRAALPPLTDSRTWILQGTRLAGGGCRYQYTTEVREIPAAGWTLRSIALDPVGCRKLME